ncbi:Cys-tRNA(Pro)/Cys-tRNA(Cys) deacylase [Paenisporosarcina quisquiliarum]|jgi:Cys-tRNA(Pro)/Cys-tRNA(Cys) deacylase|uniref:Cys-tRNA(Pro) deacylase n=1 Tax=Psychrobacillus TaxID=1221880 RepID=UPI0008D36EC1|nr:Cys-tRNA(Pro) deacylase [Psychrobacillus psychrodurans]MCK1995642.1 Cys-tRNA(Pro) deacylase [Psychrobacillus psychrodurans]MCZ8538907.1 Cys-tRNA(Pro) deacylase [Psychrobacillus psychrodurans]SEM66954.1 Cys-tRNA(Pro)/Cys-tRNA(Cys) deacylase [Paenisporosarcina quisquiliarum]SFM24656.1 Cys-tRNA(Pro)/Cys-tRNA(Cys) deacylase [Psychrobacillus psychrodurans]
MSKKQKTNAVRKLEQQKITFELIEYELTGDQVDGVTVADKIGYPVFVVYKTLLVTAGTNKHFVCIIPVHKELNLKEVAQAVGEKKVELLSLKELLPTTGYIRGGCSPIGMKKLFPTWIDTSAESLDFILVSGGKIGLQIKLSVKDLLQLTNGRIATIIKM